MPSPILAIDPGPERSAWVEINADGDPVDSGIEDNGEVATLIDANAGWAHLAIESVESYGMAVGREVFQTCYWIGRFDPDATATLIPRRDVKLHLCGSARAKDSNIRQALIDRYGPGKEKAIGKKAAPGPLYGFKTHLWSALAVGVTYYDQLNGRA